MRNEIINGDSFEVLQQIEDKSFDAVIIDPPYGMGIDKWDTPLMPEEIAFFTEQVKRVGKEFYAVFGQMPYIREWDRQAEKQGLYFLEHVSWVKRNVTQSKRLSKGHEECYIYAINDKRDFYKNLGRYEDVKLPGVLLDIVSCEAIARYIKDLWVKLETGKHRKDMKKKGHKRHQRFSLNSDRSPRMANFTNVWSFYPPSLKKRDGKQCQIHCTQKNDIMLMRLVEMLTPENGSVIDFFSGSGTTAIACKRLDRQFLCIEKEQEFYENSVKRLAGDVYQPELNFDLN